jgi:hypothetical protein
MQLTLSFISPSQMVHMAMARAPSLLCIRRPILA